MELENKTTEEIFEIINTHMTRALMFHSEMVNYFEFLGLKGFRKLHEYQYFDESIGRMNFESNYISMFNKLIKKEEIENINIIPKELYNYSKLEVTKSAISKYVKHAWNEYIKWEKETKELYKNACILLYNRDKICECSLVFDYLKDVQNELIEVYKIQETLNSSDYDNIYILEIQDDLFKMYEKKMKTLKA